MSHDPLAISLGDPAGIGAEVTLRALDSLPRATPVWLFGHWEYAMKGAGSGMSDLDLGRFSSVEGAVKAKVVRAFVEVAQGGAELEIGTIKAEYGRIALDSIEQAADAVAAGHCSALVTAPIHKGAVIAAGSDFHGHTELLAARAGLREYGRDFAMMFDSPSLRVVLATVHAPLRDVPGKIDETLVSNICCLTTREVGRLIGKKPLIGVAGLNPHAGEGGAFGDEETAIAAGIDLAEAKGCSVEGPYPADTLFSAASRGRYDVVLAMYHDQGLTPVKTLHFESSVNVTLGLPYLRVSVDHGTAFDIAGKGRAESGSMKYAIEYAIRNAPERRT